MSKRIALLSEVASGFTISAALTNFVKMIKEKYPDVQILRKNSESWTSDNGKKYSHAYFYTKVKDDDDDVMLSIYISEFNLTRASYIVRFVETELSTVSMFKCYDGNQK